MIRPTHLVAAADFDGVPVAYRDGVIRTDDGWTGSDVETELNDALVQTERQKVARSVGLLAVVQNRA